MWRTTRGSLDVKPLELVAGALLAQLVCHQRLEVHRRDLLLLVRQLFEPSERGVQVLARELEAQFGQRLLERMTAGVLAEHDRVCVQPHGGCVHDLVGGALLEHAVLMDAGLVGEGVAADDGFVGLDRIPGQA